MENNYKKLREIIGFILAMFNEPIPGIQESILEKLENVFVDINLEYAEHIIANSTLEIRMWKEGEGENK